MIHQKDFDAGYEFIKPIEITCPTCKAMYTFTDIESLGEALYGIKQNNTVDHMYNHKPYIASTLEKEPLAFVNTCQFCGTKILITNDNKITIRLSLAGEKISKKTRNGLDSFAKTKVEIAEESDKEYDKMYDIEKNDKFLERHLEKEFWEAMKKYLEQYKANNITLDEMKSLFRIDEELPSITVPIRDLFKAFENPSNLWELLPKKLQKYEYLKDKEDLQNLYFTVAYKFVDDIKYQYVKEKVKIEINFIINSENQMENKDDVINEVKSFLKTYFNEMQIFNYNNNTVSRYVLREIFSNILVAHSTSFMEVMLAALIDDGAYYDEKFIINTGYKVDNIETKPSLFLLTQDYKKLFDFCFRLKYGLDGRYDYWWQRLFRSTLIFDGDVLEKYKFAYHFLRLIINSFEKLNLEDTLFCERTVRLSKGDTSSAKDIREALEKFYGRPSKLDLYAKPHADLF